MKNLLALFPIPFGVFASVVGEIQGQRWHPLTAGLAMVGMGVMYWIGLNTRKDYDHD